MGGLDEGPQELTCGIRIFSSSFLMFFADLLLCDSPGVLRESFFAITSFLPLSLGSFLWPDHHFIPRCRQPEAYTARLIQANRLFQIE